MHFKRQRTEIWPIHLSVLGASEQVQGGMEDCKKTFLAGPLDWACLLKLHLDEVKPEEWLEQRMIVHRKQDFQRWGERGLVSESDGPNTQLLSLYHVSSILCMLAGYLLLLKWWLSRTCQQTWRGSVASDRPIRGEQLWCRPSVSQLWLRIQ